jgi:hypothetical protein
MKPVACMLLGFVLVWTAVGVGEDVKPDTRVGDFVFTMPTGWYRENGKGGVTYLFLPGHRAGAITYIALLANDLNGDFKTTFEQEWNGFGNAYRIVSGGEISPVENDDHDEALVTSALMTDQKGVQWNMCMMGVNYQKKLNLVLFMSNLPPGPNYDVARDGFVKFAGSLKFGGKLPGEGDPAALPKSSGRYNGIYRAITPVKGDPLSDLPNAVTVKFTYVTFLADGRFKEGIAEQGLTGFDEDAAIRANPVGWGTYLMKDDLGHIVFPPAPPLVADQIVWPIKEYPDKLLVHGDEYHLMASCDGVKLEGTFRRADWQTRNAATQGITFQSDGTFADEGVMLAVGAQTRDRNGQFVFDDGTPGKGTYRLGGYTLELTYSDGRVKRTSIYMEPAKSKDGNEFYLNTWLMRKVGN